MKKMKNLVLLLMIFFAVTRITAASPLLSSLIVGGVQASNQEFPYIVSLREGSIGHFCAGSLVAADWVLTAAHCIKGTDLSRVHVVAGSQKLDDPSGTETFTVRQAIIHPGYDPSTSDFDYALLQLNGKSHFTPVALNDAPVDIPENADQAPMATVVGWGTTSENGALSNELMKVTLPLIDSARCNAAYAGKITDEMLCAGYEAGLKDACQGDSGGPLIIGSSKGTPLLTGVVSWGVGCAEPGKFGVYSKVSKAAAWISQTIAPAASGA